MDEQKEVGGFIEQLCLLNQSLVDIFKSGDIQLFSKMNGIIKKMYAVQHGSKIAALVAIDEDCEIIYKNFDMIIAVLRSTEEGVIDAGAQNALNTFLHNINVASIRVASALGIV